MSSDLSLFQQLSIIVNLATSLFLYLSIFSEYVKPWPRTAKLGYAALAGLLLIEAVLSFLFNPPPYQEELKILKHVALLILGLSLSAVMLWKRHCWYLTHKGPEYVGK